MSAYYNDNDPFMVEWLKHLIKRKVIADGEVDGRSIKEIDPKEISQFTQCHFFAGIGVWSFALRRVGWPDALGSTLYRLSWKKSVTPSGRRLYQLVASVRPTSVNESTSWPTPTALSFHKSHQPGTNKFCETIRMLVPWPSPNVDDANNVTRSSGEFKSLAREVRFAAVRFGAWTSPAARDWKDSPGMSSTGTNPDGSQRKRTDQLPRQVQQMVSGPTQSGSNAATEGSGQFRLNPRFSLWLMGLPVEEWASFEEQAMRLSRRRRKRLSKRS